MIAEVIVQEAEDYQLIDLQEKMTQRFAEWQAHSRALLVGLLNWISCLNRSVATRPAALCDRQLLFEYEQPPADHE